MKEKHALQGGTLRIRVMIVVIPDQERGGWIGWASAVVWETMGFDTSLAMV